MVQGITSCHKFAERDSKGFFQRQEKEASVEEVLSLLGELSSCLSSLGSTMSYSRENYASPSGINMPELLRIQELLVSQPEPNDAKQQQTELVEIVAQVQSTRVRRGFTLVAECTRIIQELTGVFGLQRSIDG